MKRLTSTHAEDVGGHVVEPGDEFDESDADEATVRRLQSEGKLADVGKTTRKPKESD